MKPYRRTVSLFVVAVCIAAWVSGLAAQPRPTGKTGWDPIGL
jgi:hypothetical protein